MLFWPAWDFSGSRVSSCLPNFFFFSEQNNSLAVFSLETISETQRNWIWCFSRAPSPHKPPSIISTSALCSPSNMSIRHWWLPPARSGRFPCLVGALHKQKKSFCCRVEHQIYLYVSPSLKGLSKHKEKGPARWRKRVSNGNQLSSWLRKEPIVWSFIIVFPTKVEVKKLKWG